MTNPINRNLINLEAYVPGEQPVGTGWIKLNTNENPYPPAAEVIEVLSSFSPERIRKYPPPDAAPLRKAVGEALDWPPEGVMITNGSDEALRMCCHAYLNAGEAVGMLSPTYSLYPILGRMFGTVPVISPVERDGTWPERITFDGVRLFFIANPNPPYGTFYDPHEIAGLVATHQDVLFVIDEAYEQFASGDCLTLLHEFKNLLIARTFSKSHSLAGLRVGYVVGDPDRMAPLWVVRDSYNVNALSQAAALAAWQAADYYRSRIAQIVQLRDATVGRLETLGFDVLPSEANFVFARHELAPRLSLQLKERKILVRYFDAPPTRDGLRITIGTPEQMDALLATLSELL